MRKIDDLLSWIEKDDDVSPDELIYEIDREAVLVEDEIVDEKRWSIVHSQVWSLTDGSFIRFSFESPATEMQEGQPYNTSAEEVEPYEVTVTKFREIK